MICLIVLAAGLSTRFGRNKLLEWINGFSMIQRVVKSAIDSNADEVIVVLGYEADLIKQNLKGLKCKFVYNENFKQGQSSSVKIGLVSVLEYARALIVLPGDIALISPNTINRLIEEYRRSKSPIIVASHQDRLGHPILFDRALFNEILGINEKEMGLKAIMKRHEDSISKIEVGSSEVLIDFDTEEDIRMHFLKGR